MRTVVLAALGAVLTYFVPGPARACGGTFCDAAPPSGQTMPVDQTGETILFVDDGPFVEAHIQIEYTGDPERFAWIIPLPAEPEVGVGSQALFDNLLVATVPTYDLDNRFGGCWEDGSGVGVPYLFCCACGGDGASAGFGSDTDTDGFPDILQRGVAGSFEFVVLTADTVGAVTSWLGGNGYEQDPDADPILQEYLDEGFLFLAVKLRAGAGLDAIHPITVRYPGEEPCIPIRLTRIAAREDMAIRAFFLGDRRVAPRNYPHVVLNQARIDWILDLASNYTDLVSEAVDEAGGRAWVTEYAGGTDVVSQEGLSGPIWSFASFENVPLVDLISRLQTAGLYCGSDECNHPMILPLLLEHLPPSGIVPAAFYGCVECYLDEAELEAWDPVVFAAALEENIFAPARHARSLLDRHPRVTRLFTTMSPDEMTVDPLFHVTDLPNPDPSDRSAMRVLACEGPDWLELWDGSYLSLDATPVLDDLPAALRIEEVPATGVPTVIVDNAEVIADGLSDWNREWPLAHSSDLPANAHTDREPGCSAHGHHVRGALAYLGLFGGLFLARTGRRRNGD